MLRKVLGTHTLHEPLSPSAIALGVFDGVHLGHRALTERAVALSKQHHLQSLALTFDPTPASVLCPKNAPHLIEPIEWRIKRLGQLGVDTVLVEPFSLELAKMPPEVFVVDVLVQQLRARHVIVGQDFTFGRNRKGNVALLHELGLIHSFSVEGVGAVLHRGERVSSSRIRTLIKEGDMPTAASMLGRPYAIMGPVQHGDGRGTTIGFPTANIATPQKLIPCPGVYAAWVQHEKTSTNNPSMPAVVNVGYAPTFERNTLRIEAHILDYNGPSLYGTSLQVQFIHRLRGELRFKDVDALQIQIQLDVIRARKILSP